MAARLGTHLLRSSVTALVAQQRQQHVRTFHASTAVLARQARRGGGRTSRSKAAAMVDSLEDFGDDEDEDGKPVKTARFFTQGEFDENPDLANEVVVDDDDDDDDDDDEETKEFLKGVDEMFTLDPNDFGRRLERMDVGEDGSRRAVYGETEEDTFEADEEEEEEIDRAERIPKKRLLKVLDEFDAMKPRSSKNNESIGIPKTKILAPLEKKKKMDPERISHRQERVELSVLEFVQDLLVEDADMLETDVFPHLVEASVAPDLRRVVLYWEPVRRNSANQEVIAKRKTEGVKKRLEKIERWVRMSVTRHLNLKYSPIVQFKLRKNSNSEERRSLFDREMAWLDRFK
ncbi:hypothetical protein Poli38472_002096 [Pythium oligandrum]|uniref:Ribosome-binding factor A n=1 Tax=Pythium oligandrum TaxID=41045 RepID=A0A8K1CI52_PYTOL|nr:hypothetical protein Poli38472_002096 [Pythium oligandrum]|eukprot:TMW63155.1 hypothetical protein Poli38472_002096 [Pythium oligandrum]